jgi:hypothetical protein
MAKVIPLTILTFFRKPVASGAILLFWPPSSQSLVGKIYSLSACSHSHQLRMVSGVSIWPLVVLFAVLSRCGVVSIRFSLTANS